MAWTFNLALSTSLDKVRALIGDVDAARPLVQDETILAVLEGTPNVYAAASIVAGVLATLGAVVVRERFGDVQTDYAAPDYATLATTLRDQAETSASFVAPYAGGLSISEKQTAEQDTDLVRPSFTRELHNTTGRWP